MIHNLDNTIDSRDINERISELELEAQGRYDDAHPEGVSWGELADLNVGDWLDAEDTDEYNNLVCLVADAKYVEDWEYGALMIRESYFTEYAEELASEIGAIDADAGWPLMYIDWEAAAESLKMDYTTLDFDGVTYYAR